MTNDSCFSNVRQGLLRVARRRVAALGASVDTTPKTCKACRYSYMEPDSPLVCGHPDSGAFGLALYREPVAHCGWRKFDQHPLRTPEGGFKGYGDFDHSKGVLVKLSGEEVATEHSRVANDD